MKNMTSIKIKKTYTLYLTNPLYPPLYLLQVISPAPLRHLPEVRREYACALPEQRGETACIAVSDRLGDLRQQALRLAQYPVLIIRLFHHRIIHIPLRDSAVH